MKIPKNLKIGAQTVKVRFRDKLIHGDEEQLGISKMSTNKIELARTYMGEKLPEGSVTDTFLHEILHASNTNYGIGLKEDQVCGLAGALLAVIRDNDLDFRK